MSNPYENLLFGPQDQPNPYVNRVRVNRLLNQNRHRLQGLSIEQQIKLIATLLFGSGAASQAIASYSYNRLKSILEHYWSRHPANSEDYRTPETSKRFREPDNTAEKNKKQKTDNTVNRPLEFEVDAKGNQG